MKLWRVADINEEELFTVARSYLPMAFPNPNRDGCPPETSLRALAWNPRTTNPSIEEHISFCSPCVARYLEILSEQRITAAARRRIWIFRLAVGFATIFVVSLCVFIVAKYHTKPIVRERTPAPAIVPTEPAQTETAVYVPVLIDLSNAAPTRGSERAASSAQQIIPSTARLDLIVRLPLGSAEQQYSVMLRSKLAIAWAQSAPARRQNGDTLLHVHADFSHVPVGNYELQIASDGKRLTIPVFIKDTSPQNTEPKP
jgi:hypothetical protein